MLRSVAVALALLLALAPAALAQNDPARPPTMGDPGMGPDTGEPGMGPSMGGAPSQPPPSAPGMGGETKNGDSTAPANPANPANPGPFARPNPEHNPGMDRLPGVEPPSFAELIEAVAAGLGYTGETGKKFVELMTSTEDAKNRAARQAEEELTAARLAARDKLGKLMSDAQLQQLVTVVQAIEAFKTQAAQINQAAQAGQATAERARRALDNAVRNVEQQYIALLGAERAAELNAFFRNAALTGKQPPAGEVGAVIGRAVGISADATNAFIAESTKLAQMQTQLNQRRDRLASAAETRRREGLAGILTVEQQEKLGRLVAATEGYKAAIAELRRVASQPGVPPDAVAAQRDKVERNVMSEFEAIIVPEQLARFLGIWERVKPR